MLLREYDEDAFEELADKNKPISGVCFWVITEFNIAHAAVKRRFKTDSSWIEPDSFATYPEAVEMADEYAVEIKNRFRGSLIQRITDDFREDEFHLYIVDKMANPIAKIGVVGEDYRRQTLH